MTSPDIRAAAHHAQDFSRRFDGVRVTVYECRHAGDPRPVGYVPFIIGEPENQDGLVYTPVGSFKAGKSAD